MGAELISAVLEIKKNINPDWKKAEMYIQNMDDLVAVNTYSDILQLGDEYTEEDLEDIPLEIENAKKAFMDALFSCQAGWENSHRFMNKIQLRSSVILLAAGETYGDNIDHCDDIILFDGCGAAKEAGFY